MKTTFLLLAALAAVAVDAAPGQYTGCYDDTNARVRNVVAQCKCNSPHGDRHECNDCGHDDDGEERYLGYDSMTHSKCYNYCNDEFGGQGSFYYAMEWKGECYCTYVACGLLPMSTQLSTNLLSVHANETTDQAETLHGFGTR